MDIKTKILIPVIALTLLVSGGVLVSDILLFSGFVNESTVERVNSASKVAVHHLSDLETKAASVSLSVAENREVIDAIENNDRGELLAHAMRLLEKTGVDFCTVADRKGSVILRTHEPDNYGDSVASQANVRSAMAGERLTAVEQGTTVSLAVRSSIPVFDDSGAIVGIVSVGYRLDTEQYVDSIKDITGCEATIFLGNKRISTTVLGADGGRALGTTANPRISETVLAGNAYTGEADILGRIAVASYSPLGGADGQTLGMLFVGKYLDETAKTTRSFVQSGVIIALIMLAAFIVVILIVTGRIVTPIRAMTKAASALASGDTDIDLKVNTKDEMRTLADAFNRIVLNTRQQVQMVEQIAGGGLPVPVKARSEKDIMNRALEELNTTIRAQASAIKEEYERIKLMLDATPLASRLWNRDFELIECNEAAVKLFNLSSKKEYMERYFDLSPEYQNEGQTTRDRIKMAVSETFEKGACTYEWTYRMLDGTPIPAEVTMVRVPYGGDYVVAAYSRDLREQKKMMAEIEHRDKLLNAGHSTSFTLFDAAEDKDIGAVLTESMELLGQCVGADQAYIAQNETIDGILHFTCKYAWAGGGGEAIVPGMRFPYGRDLDWDDRFARGQCMNGPVKDLPASIQDFFAPFKTKSALVIPVFVQEQFWGLVGFSDREKERAFGKDEVDILRSMSLMMAVAVNRSVQAAAIREAHHRTRLLTNSTPLGFNMWDRSFLNIETNDTAVKLFGLGSQKEYLERFLELSPEYQSDGSLSREKSAALLNKTFEEGYCQFEWLHQKPDGTPIPAEITLVRIAYGDDYVVAGYIRDIREYKKMMAEIEQRDHLLRTVNEAADILLRSEPDDFADTLSECMGMMARAINADRMYLNKNYLEDGKLYRTQLYEWRENAPPLRDAGVSAGIPYDETAPEMSEALRSGNCINCLVSDMPNADRERLNAHGALSALIVPVFIRNEFWGVVGFNNCRGERLFTENEESVMRSGSLLIANALLRNEHSLRIRETSVKLETALADAEAANSAKSDFLAGISHEMRTPLNAIIGLSEITLDNTSLDGEAQSNLEKVYNSGSTLLSIINDLLDISKVQAGKFVILESRYDVPSLINDAILQNVLRIGSKPIRFMLAIDENMPACLWGDELRVKQIINNLLSNAIKYTEEGTVELGLNCERDGAAEWLTISARDTGIGIRPEHLEHLFTDYMQFGSTSRRQAGGTGLGLAITKSLVEMMSGSITVESKYGEGSVFTARVRQRYAGDTVIGAGVVESLKRFQYSAGKLSRNSNLNRVRLPYARVLVVDDNITNLDVARGLMKPYGMKIDCVISGREAVEAVRDEKVKYNAVFMDHMMPEMDGVEAARIIREEIGTEYARTVPIIALTANAVAGSEAMFLKNGFQGFISKPIDLSRLDEVIRRFVRDKVQEALLEESWLEAERGGEDGSGEKGLHPLLKGLRIDGVDIDKSLERFGGDEGTVIDVLRSYAANTRPLLGTMREYLKSGNFEDYAIAIHGIKGASYGIFAQEAGKSSESLEVSAKAGNFETVKTNHRAFEKITEKLLDEIDNALEKIDSVTGKPSAAAPDPAILAEIREASKAFDMDRVDSAMDRLESFRYESGENIVAWLREQVNNMAFEEIYGGKWPSLETREYVDFTAPGAEILIVDDNETNLKAAAGLLKPLSMRVDTAENGKTALKMIGEKQYHLVLMDYLMPGMDGVETVARLRQTEGDYYQKLPVIAVTANEAPGAKESFFRAGANDFVAKPIEIKEICEKLKRWLPEELILEKAGGSEDPHAAEAPAEAPWDLPVIEGIDAAEGIRYSGSRELFIGLLGDFYKLIDTKAAGIEKFLAGGQLRELTIEVHALKNTARLIGAGELSEGFSRLERYGREENREALERETPVVLERYRSFKPLLEPFGEIAEQEKKEASGEELTAILEELKSAMDGFDLDGADEALKRLEERKLPEECRPQMETLRAYMADVAMEDVVKAAEEMIETIKKRKEGVIDGDS